MLCSDLRVVGVTLKQSVGTSWGEPCLMEDSFTKDGIHCKAEMSKFWNKTCVLYSEL